MRTTDIHIDEGALSLCRLLLRATEVPEPPRPAPADAKPSLWEHFDRWFARLRLRDRERYLSQSRDIFELETRIRLLERHPYY